MGPPTFGSRTFSVTIEKDPNTGYFTAQCVELPAAISQGKTEKEAEENVKEAMRLVLEYLRDKAEVTKKGKKLVEVEI